MASLQINSLYTIVFHYIKAMGDIFRLVLDLYFQGQSTKIHDSSIKTLWWPNGETCPFVLYLPHANN